MHAALTVEGANGKYTMGQSSGTPTGSSYSGPTPMELGAMQKSPIKCYFCGKQGHIKKNCFKYIKKQEQDKAKKAGNKEEPKN